jgi:hypothetical protein
MMNKSNRAARSLAAEFSLVVLVLVLLAGSVSGQTLGTKYTWVDSLAVTTTKADTILPYSYEQCSLWLTGCSGKVKLGGVSDTTEFASRYWLPLDTGQILTTGPADRLKRLWFKSTSGSGTLWIIGYKTVPQW